MTPNGRVIWFATKIAPNTILYRAPDCPDKLAQLVCALSTEKQTFSKLKYSSVGSGGYGTVWRPRNHNLRGHVIKQSVKVSPLHPNPDLCLGLSALQANIAIEYGLACLKPSEKTVPIHTERADDAFFTVTSAQHLAAAVKSTSAGVCVQSHIAMSHEKGKPPLNHPERFLFVGNAALLTDVLDLAVRQSGLEPTDVDYDLSGGGANYLMRPTNLPAGSPPRQMIERVKLDSMANRSLADNLANI